MSTKRLKTTTNDGPAQPPPGGGFWSELHGSTLKLAAVFWAAVLLTDSLVWGLAGTDPIESALGKLALNTVGALLAAGLSAVLYRVRGHGLLVKAVLAFVLALLCAPLYGWVDFKIYQFFVWPQVPAFDWRTFGYTLVSSMAMFFGWACLYIALMYAFEMRDRERSLAAAREEALAAQMRALRYQVNPHFLFNTLNSIAGLIEEGASARAGGMVLALSSFLRTTLAMDPLQDVALEDELLLQEGYLGMERERFPDRMSYVVDVPEEARQALVPSLILQPLIENAVRHGVGQSLAPTRIRIAARRRGARLWVAVENDVHAGPDGAAAGFGIGLRNAAQRIRMRFGEGGRFDAGRVDGGRFRAEFEMPWTTA